MALSILGPAGCAHILMSLFLLLLRCANQAIHSVACSNIGISSTTICSVGLRGYSTTAIESPKYSEAGEAQNPPRSRKLQATRRLARDGRSDTGDVYKFEKLSQTPTILRNTPLIQGETKAQTPYARKQTGYIHIRPFSPHRCNRPQKLARQTHAQVLRTNYKTRHQVLVQIHHITTSISYSLAYKHRT